MPINAYVKNKRNNILPQNRCPVALLFKDGGGLAYHPLSCHPQGVFGRWENERKGKQRENLLLLCISTKSPPKKSILRFYKGLSLYKALIRKIQKYPKFTLIHEGKKWEKGSQKVKSRKHEQCWKLEQCARNGNFAPRCEIFAGFIFLASSALLSFLFLIYKAEFDSNSSFLDQFNKFGINSLQKLQN